VPARGALQEAVLDWYRAEGRVFAFRETRDPYAILVSEVMAQQTQIARVVERWAAFLERFPSFEALAAATPADVLRAWQGLGYDRRALNLWRCARVVVDELGGQLPRDVAALERLPGVGPYTARALAALAFGSPVGAVDVNVRRVIGRVVAGVDPRGPVSRRWIAAIRPARRMDTCSYGSRSDVLPSPRPTLRRLPGATVVPLRGHGGGHRFPGGHHRFATASRRASRPVLLHDPMAPRPHPRPTTRRRRRHVG
jgi:endonuclease III